MNLVKIVSSAFVLFAACLLFQNATFSQSLKNDDQTIFELVLRDVVLKGIIENWQVSPKGRSAVLADRSVAAVFPQSQAQALKEREATERLQKGEDVDISPYLFGNPSPSADHVMSEGHVIPKDVVADILRRGKRPQHLPRLTLDYPLKLIIEKSEVIQTTFRSGENPNSAFETMHPSAVGVIEMSLPGYSGDKNTAGVYFSRYRTGLGGGEFFVLLKRTDSWHIEWVHTVMIE